MSFKGRLVVLLLFLMSKRTSEMLLAKAPDEQGPRRTGSYVEGLARGATQDNDIYDVRYKWQVGEWVAYQIKSSSGGSRTAEIAIVGEKMVSGKRYYWVEFAGVEDDLQVVTKQLVSTDGDDLKDVFVQKGGSDAVALRSGSWVRLDSGEGLGAFVSPRNVILTPPTAGEGSTETIATLAGSFKAVRCDGKDGTYWISKEVPITGIVKGEIKRIGEVTLMRYGRHGATSRIKNVVKDAIPIPLNGL